MCCCAIIFALSSFYVLIIFVKNVSCLSFFCCLVCSCSLVVSCWERADLLALLRVVFSCVLSLSNMCLDPLKGRFETVKRV